MRRDLLVCSALLALTLICFWPATHHEFINYDDPEYVVGNPVVQAGITARGIMWACTTTHTGNWIPLTWLSHMLDCEIFGLNSTMHHVVNLLIHAANVLLVFGVLYRLTGALYPSALVAAMFGVHPLHIESVAWVAERKDLLCGFFSLLTLWFYGRFGQRREQKDYLLAVGSFTAALLSKPMAVTIPIILLLLDFWPLGRCQTGKRENRWRMMRELVWEKRVMFALALVAGIVAMLAQRSQGTVAHFEHLSLRTRIAAAFVSLVTYLAKTFWPQKLAVFYPHYEVTWWQFGGAALIALLLSVLALCSWRSRPFLLVGWFWFVIMLLPVIGMMQVGAQMLANRYTYLPLIGVFITLAWGVAAVGRALPGWRPVAFASVVVVIGACTLMTRSELEYWQNSISLFSRSVEVTQDSALAHNNLGVAYAKDGQQELAKEHFRRAFKILPRYTNARVNLASVLARPGTFDQAETVLIEAIRLEPSSISGHRTLALVYVQMNRIPQAREQCLIVLVLKPNDGQMLALRDQIGAKPQPDEQSIIQ